MGLEASRAASYKHPQLVWADLQALDPAVRMGGGGEYLLPQQQGSRFMLFPARGVKAAAELSGKQIAHRAGGQGGETSSAIPSLILANRLIPFPHNQRPSGSQRAANHASGRGSVRSCSGVSDADMQAANLPAGEHMQARQAKAARGVISKPFCLGS